MASSVLADLTRALQGTNRGSEPTMEESENEVGNLEQLLLYADEHYLAGKLPLGDHLEKVLYGVKEYRQLNVERLRFPASLSLCPQTITPALRAVYRCSGVKGSARKRRLDLRFASARCLEIVCGTIATPTSARIVERVTGGRVYKSLPHDPSILSPCGLSGYSRPGFPHVGTFSCPLLPTISNGNLLTIHLARNTVRRSACSFHSDDQVSLNLA
ncbi:15-hydroxyprostaglandin dehydrogenase [Trichonephila clavipes]|nr:15-hydroxyprostaglandin dehydrogenase [Trichonephila clavipes]